jgi:NAD(P)H-dependent FMN reductase
MWRIAVLLGSCRTGRQSLAVARFILARLRQDERLQAVFLDLAEYRFPLMDQRLDEMPCPPEDLLEFAGQLSAADGILIIVPEYKNGYPGVLKNALDHLAPGAFRHRPVAIVTVSSGGFGGLLCLAQMRLVCLALAGLPIPATLAISHVQDRFDPQGRLIDGTLEPRFDAFLTEFLWHVEAMGRQRAQARSTEGAVADAGPPAPALRA